MPLADNGEVTLLYALLGSVAVVDDRWIGLITAAPANERVQLVEPGGDYKRAQVRPVPFDGPTPAWTLTSVNAGPSRVVNNEQYVFGPLPAVTIVGWAMWAESLAEANAKVAAGQLKLLPLLWGIFPTEIVVPANGTVVIPSGALTVTLD